MKMRWVPEKDEALALAATWLIWPALHLTAWAVQPVLADISAALPGPTLLAIDVLLLSLLYNGGLKVGETCALRWRDVNTDAATINVTGFASINSGGFAFVGAPVMHTTSRLWIIIRR